MTAAADPLALFYTHRVQIERRIGRTASGVTFEAPEVVMAKVRRTTQEEIDGDGTEVTQATVVSTAVDTRTVPEQSRVTLLDDLDAAGNPIVVHVVSQERHDLKIPGAPAYYRFTAN